MQITFIIGHPPLNDIEFKAGGFVFFIQDCPLEQQPSTAHTIDILSDGAQYRLNAPDGQFFVYNTVFHSQLTDCVLLKGVV